MSFSVRVEPSGHIFTVEDNEAILDAALRQGFALPYGCRGGACGACMGQLLEGSVAYPDGDPIALSEEDKAANKAIFCQAVATSDLVIESKEVGEAKDIPVKILPCRIAEKTQLSHDVMLLKLKLPATERMQFLAGQYIDFLLKDGKKRTFSIANAPHDDEFIELHIRHIPHGRFTSEVFDNLKVKDIMRIEGPMGNFFLREDSNRPIIFMAGGTGFAPIKGIIEHLIQVGIDRKVRLYWGVQKQEDLYMNELAQGWADQHDNIEYIPVLSGEDIGDWQGRTGYVTNAIADDFEDLSEYEIYASGAPAMVYAGKELFAAKGLNLDNYYSDAFEFAND
ncbi:MAG: CDP-6-deoxy-delta-3,4-glucoseen reductase [Thioalkalispiraceae bacterium]|jgi:CDP-4-dehydro-6-deoxyglucose reductase